MNLSVIEITDSDEYWTYSVVTKTPDAYLMCPIDNWCEDTFGPDYWDRFSIEKPRWIKTDHGWKFHYLEDAHLLMLTWN